MATIRAYTNIEQSRKLAEILPLESADMVYVHTVDLEGDEHYDIDFRNNQPLFEDDISAWSLAALLAFLPNSAFLERGSITELYRITLPIELVPFDWFVEPVDACVAMIEKLYELKML